MLEENSKGEIMKKLSAAFFALFLLVTSALPVFAKQNTDPNADK